MLIYSTIVVKHFKFIFCDFQQFVHLAALHIYCSQLLFIIKAFKIVNSVTLYSLIFSDGRATDLFNYSSFALYVLTVYFYPA